MQSFTLDTLVFDSDTVYVFDIDRAQYAFACPAHNGECISFAGDHAPFVLLRAKLFGQDVLRADLVQFGIRGCSIGYIATSDLPEQCIEFMTSSLYQISIHDSQDIEDSVREKRFGIVKGIRIGEPSNRLNN